MPDLTTQSFALCRSAQLWQREVRGSEGKIYFVRWGRYGHKEGTQFGYSCSCKAFQFRSGLCKHVKAVRDEHCGWHQFMDGGEPTEKGYCPECEGVITYENRRVSRGWFGAS